MIHYYDILFMQCNYYYSTYSCLCVRVVEIEIQGCGYGVVNGTSIEFQLSKLFAYPNIETSGVGQRGSDNQGWTVLLFLSQVCCTCMLLPFVCAFLFA